MDKIFQKRLKRKRKLEHRVHCHGSKEACGKVHPMDQKLSRAGVTRNQVFDLIQKDIERRKLEEKEKLPWRKRLSNFFKKSS